MSEGTFPDVAAHMHITLKIQGPVFQSIVSLTSSLVLKVLTVLVSTISNSQVFLLKKNVSSFCKCKSYSHLFFSKNISVHAIFNDLSFNDALTNDIVCFEQLGPVKYCRSSSAICGPTLATTLREPSAFFRTT